MKAIIAAAAAAAAAAGAVAHLLVQAQKQQPGRSAADEPGKDDAGEGDLFGAFISKEDSPMSAAKEGSPLEGLTFAVKDIFDVAGQKTGFGTPAWLDAHEEAKSTAPAVSSLIEAGGRCMGRTHMDEMAYSIEGVNEQYGDVINPAAPGCIPGGSSSGSAVAVAAGAVDFALGTDTGGSVRVPASCCGILGLRTTHGAVAVEGVVPMAQSFDTVGVFARDAGTLRRAGRALLGLPPPSAVVEPPHSGVIGRLLVPDDILALCHPAVKCATEAAAAVLAERLGEHKVARVTLSAYLDLKAPGLKAGRGKEGGGGSSTALGGLRDAFRAAQAAEFHENHGAWVARAKPALGAGVAERVRAAGKSKASAVAAARVVIEEVRGALRSALPEGTMLLLPTIPAPPLPRSAGAGERDKWRASAMLALCVAGVGGLPQITMPCGEADAGGDAGAAPLGVSLVGGAGADASLLDAAVAAAPLVAAAAQEALAAWAAAGAVPPAPRPPSAAAGTSKDPKAARKAGSKAGANAGGKGGAGGGAGSSKSQEAKVKGTSKSEEAKVKGNEHFKAGRFGPAVDLYTRAIRLDAGNPVLYANRAMAHLKLHNFKEAEVDCSSALALDPAHVKSLLRRGTARAFLCHYQDAYSDFQKVLEVEPGNGAAKSEIRKLKQLTGF